MPLEAPVINAVGAFLVKTSPKGLSY